MKQQLNKLEVIRGVAALYVVFHHSFFSTSYQLFGQNLSFLFRFGQEAVILFFLMSGFLIGYSFELSKDKSFLSYFLRRFYRIYIPLLIVLLTNYLLLSMARGYFVNPEWLNLGGNMLMLQDSASLKPNVICTPYLDNSPLWSLSYEWWFYMSFYVLYKLFGKIRRVDLIVAGLVIISALSYLWYPNFINRLFMYYGIWWAGVAMAKSYLKHARVRTEDLNVSGITLLITTMILAANCYIHKENIKSIGISPLLELRHFGFTIVVLITALIWQKSKWRYFDSMMGKFAVLAPVSYVLYISHHFLVIEAYYLKSIGNRYIEFFIYLAVAIIYSYLVEVIAYPKIKAVFTKKTKKLKSITENLNSEPTPKML